MNSEEILKLFDSFSHQNEIRIIAIDGRSCSGKSTLASSLRAKFDCHVFHIDDFFLPNQMRTPSRLTEIGGNIHQKRFQKEVIFPIQKNEPVRYQPYSCLKEAFLDVVLMKPKKLNIVEGTYSMLPMFQPAYDFSVFLTVDNDVQLERVVNREGKERAGEFVQKWIPKEERYFNQLAISSKCDVIVDTTTC